MRCQKQRILFMKNIIIERRRNSSLQLGFVLGCLINYKFNSFKNFILYILHFSSIIDLRVKSSKEYTEEELAKILNVIFDIKIEKKYLYELTGFSKNTFNKYFKEYLQKEGLLLKRKLNLLELYKLLNHWLGYKKWGMMQSIKKKNIAEILNNGNYKKIAEKFDEINFNDTYKSKDSLSPKEVKEFIDYYKLKDTKEEELLLKYKEFHKLSLWSFGVLIFMKALENWKPNSRAN